MKLLDTNELIHALTKAIYKLQDDVVIAKKNDNGIVKDKIISHYTKQLDKLHKIDKILSTINKI